MKEKTNNKHIVYWETIGNIIAGILFVSMWVWLNYVITLAEKNFFQIAILATLGQASLITIFIGLFLLIKECGER